MSAAQWAGSVVAGMLVMVAFPDIGVWRRVALIAAIAIIALVASEATS